MLTLWSTGSRWQEDKTADGVVKGRVTALFLSEAAIRYTPAVTRGIDTPASNCLQDGKHQPGLFFVHVFDTNLLVLYDNKNRFFGGGFMNSLRALKKATFTDVLDYGIFLFRKHFKEILILNLIFNIPAMILLTVFNPVFTEQYGNLLNPAGMVTVDPNEILPSMLTLYAMLFGSVVLQGIYTLTLKNFMEGSIVKIIYSDIVLNRKRTVKQAVKECFSQFGMLLLGRMLYILIQCAVFAVLYIVLVAGMFALSFGIIGMSAAGFTSPKTAVVMGASGILIVAVTIIFILMTVGFFCGKYWMFLPAICIEQQKAGSSIGRCNSIGRNGFFLIGLTFASGYILVWLFPFVVSSVFSIVSLVSGNFDIELLRIGTVITQIFSEILRPLLTCILTALYITLRVKREGLDMEITLRKIRLEEIERRKYLLQEAPDAN